MNSTNHTECQLAPADVLLIVGCITIIVVGVVGNILVLIIFRSRWKRGSTTELLICYLAVFDLLSSFFAPLIFMYWILVCWSRWDFGWFGCKLFPYIFRVFTAVSTGIILIMAIDRCQLIVFPLKGKLKRKTIHFSILVTVVVSLLWESYYANALYIRHNRLTDVCTVVPANTPSYAYPLILLTILKIVILLIVLLSSSCLVITKIQRRNQLMLSQKCFPKKPIKNQKTMRMIIIIAIVFVLTVAPRDILHLLFTWSWLGDKMVFQNRILIDRLNNWFRLLQVSNGIYNVFIYANLHAKFSKNLKQYLPCRFVSVAPEKRKSLALDSESTKIEVLMEKKIDNEIEVLMDKR
ncbi:melanopsin-A [Hydra vulgaris]|uniref:Melanopsin-A n=1 Tax=Hydra vulgaris TaxID=6087 RepID=A0ABM4B4H0_HYDVU